MNHSHDLNDILETLRQEHRSIEAPSSIELHLVDQTRRVRARRPAFRTWIWVGGLGIATAAASVLMIASRHSNHPVAAPAPVARTGVPVVSNTPQVATTPSEATPNAVDHPATVAHRRNKRAKDDDIASQLFFALPSSEGLPSPSEASVVRMQIHTDTLRQYGLELPPTAAPRTIVAEFIVGEDGLPRSIRILR
jgi:hypothetical protein